MKRLCFLAIVAFSNAFLHRSSIANFNRALHDKIQHLEVIFGDIPTVLPRSLEESLQVSLRKVLDFESIVTNHHLKTPAVMSFVQERETKRTKVDGVSPDLLLYYSFPKPNDTLRLRFKRKAKHNDDAEEDYDFEEIDDRRKSKKKATSVMDDGNTYTKVVDGEVVVHEDSHTDKEKVDKMFEHQKEHIDDLKSSINDHLKSVLKPIKRTTSLLRKTFGYNYRTLHNEGNPKLNNILASIIDFFRDFYYETKAIFDCSINRNEIPPNQENLFPKKSHYSFKDVLERLQQFARVTRNDILKSKAMGKSGLKGKGEEEDSDDDV